VQEATPPQGLIGQSLALLLQPAAFFRSLGHGRGWLVVAVLILLVVGFTTSGETQTTATTTGTDTTTSGFSLDLLSDTASSSAQTGTTTATSTTTASDTDSLLMSALLAAGGIVLTWAGQSALLSLVTMLRGHRPQMSRNLQIAVYATIPAVIMLLLRHAYFAAGGSGGMTGLSLLLMQWAGFRSLPDALQRIITVFMSNLSLFWLWGLLLLYLGARHALHGRRWSSLLVVLMWVAVSTVVPALVSEPVTTTAPRASLTTDSAAPSSESSTTTRQSSTSTGGMTGGAMGGDFGAPPDGGGAPPSGGGPGF
jgi:hypothetical protein